MSAQLTENTQAKEAMKAMIKDGSLPKNIAQFIPAAKDAMDDIEDPTDEDLTMSQEEEDELILELANFMDTQDLPEGLDNKDEPTVNLELLDEYAGTC
jgi:uncharacterized protein (UPF0147 family)